MWHPGLGAKEAGCPGQAQIRPAARTRRSLPFLSAQGPGARRPVSPSPPPPAPALEALPGSSPCGPARRPSPDPGFPQPQLLLGAEVQGHVLGVVRQGLQRRDRARRSRHGDGDPRSPPPTTPTCFIVPRGAGAAGSRRCAPTRSGGGDGPVARGARLPGHRGGGVAGKRVRPSRAVGPSPGCGAEGRRRRAPARDTGLVEAAKPRGGSPVSSRPVCLHLGLGQGGFQG